MKTSARIQAIEPSATLEMDARAKALRKEGKPVISFTTGEPDFDTPQHIKDAGEQAIRDGFTRYTPAGGIPELRDAVRERIRRDYGLDYGRKEVIVSCGAKHAIYNALMAICNPGDEVICFSPYWTSYPEMIRVAGGTPVLVTAPLEGGYLPTPASLEEALSEKTRLVIINSPNNPTGALYPEETLQAIADLLQGREVMVLSDDIYDRLVYGEGRFASITAAGEAMRERTVIIGGVSKTYAMTGWRIGYAAGPAEVIHGMEAIQSHTTSNPTSISQKAALAALTGPDDAIEAMRLEFDRRRKAMVAGLEQLPGFTVTEPMGAFYAFPKVHSLFGRTYRGKKIEGSVGLGEALLEAVNVVIVPGAAFGDDEAIRLSYALSLEEILEGIDRIRRLLEEELK